MTRFYGGNERVQGDLVEHRQDVRMESRRVGIEARQVLDERTHEGGERGTQIGSEMWCSTPRLCMTAPRSMVLYQSWLCMRCKVINRTTDLVCACVLNKP